MVSVNPTTTAIKDQRYWGGFPRTGRGARFTTTPKRASNLSRRRSNVMRFTLRGARLVDAFIDIPEGDITVEDGHIVAVGSPLGPPGKIIDVSGMLIAPGFIDVHTHGGGGFNLHTTEPEEIHAYANWAPSTGVTSFL